MSANRSPRPSAPSSAPAPLAEPGLLGSWARFWFTPADPLALRVVRVCAGVLFLAWLLPFAGSIDALFGLQGWFDQQAYADLSALSKQPGGAPRPLTWSALYLLGDSPSALAAYYWLSIATVVLFTLGLWTRITSVLTWVAVASFTAVPILDYDGDALLLLLAFYLMLGHLLTGQRRSDLSPLARVFGELPAWLRRGADDERQPSVGANLALRLLQVHFALVIVTAGLHKLQFGDWWGGVAYWYPMYPPFAKSYEEIRGAVMPQHEFVLGYLSLAAYLTLAWQILFPLFAWGQRWRFLLVGGAVVGWLGTAFLYQLPLLGPAILVGTLSFVTPAEWQRLFGLLPGLRRLAAAPEASVEATAPPVRSEAIVAGGHC